MTPSPSPNQKSTRFLSVSEYAKDRLVTPQAIRKAINDKRIKAEKIGKQWAIPRDETTSEKTIFPNKGTWTT